MTVGSEPKDLIYTISLKVKHGYIVFCVADICFKSVKKVCSDFKRIQRQYLDICAWINTTLCTNLFHYPSSYSKQVHDFVYPRTWEGMIDELV